MARLPCAPRYVYANGGVFALNTIHRSIDIVYSYTCRCCGASYLGQTRRHLHTSILEHMEVLPLTGKKRAIHSLSSVLAYPHRTGHSISPNDFTTVSSCRSNSNFELLRESLLVSMLKPPLNENISSILSLFFS